VRKRLATALDRNPVIDRNRGLNLANSETWLTEWMRLQLVPP
jgi:hypothetical protein